MKAYAWDRSGAAKKMCSRTMHGRCLPATCKLLRKWRQFSLGVLTAKLGLLGAQHGWNKARFSLDSDGITNQRGRKALGWRQELHMRFRSAYAGNFNVYKILVEIFDANPEKWIAIKYRTKCKLLQLTTVRFARVTWFLLRPRRSAPKLDFSNNLLVNSLTTWGFIFISSWEK